MSEEDWFEAAVRDGTTEPPEERDGEERVDEEKDDVETNGDEEGGVDDAAADGETGEDGEGGDAAAEPDDGDGGGGGGDDDTGPEVDATGEVQEEGDDDQAGGDDDRAGEDDDQDGEDDDQTGGNDEAEDDGTEEGGELFEEDFTAALQETDLDAEGLQREPPDPTDDAFAMGTDAGGGFGDVGVSDIDGELDSDIPRVDLGIEGLDDMIQGGVPDRSLMVAIGSAGTGKTTFGLQFLRESLTAGDRGVYLTLEETRERVIRSATEKGFAFDSYAEDGQLAVVDLDPVEMANSLETIGGELPRLIDDFGASRLVLDSVSLLEMMYDDRATRRNEIYDFAQSLKASGVTTMLTSEASQDDPYTSRHGIIEYLADAVFVLQYVRPSDFRETRLAVEIQKIRDANHSRETKPYEITNEGIDVYQQANLF